MATKFQDTSIDKGKAEMGQHWHFEAWLWLESMFGLMPKHLIWPLPKYAGPNLE